MKYVFKIFLCLMVFISLSALVSCGKISEPEPISGSGYPHSYPRY